jgi:hypothetical protein
MSTTSQTAIYNMALGHCGVTRFVQSPTDTSAEARLCNTFWDNVLEQVLGRVDWNFASRFVTLNLVDKTIPGWKYAYTYPNDCLTAREIIDSTTDLSLIKYKRGLQIPFAVVDNEVGGTLVIATNQQFAVLRYTAKVKVSSLWSPSFINCVSLLLAAKLAPALSSNPKFPEQLGKAYEAALLDAAASSFNEQHSKAQPESELITVRG